METKYIYLLIGVVIGWITKFPLLLKWYSELRKTRSYEKMRDAVHYHEMKEKYNKAYPNAPIK